VSANRRVFGTLERFSLVPSTRTWYLCGGRVDGCVLDGFTNTGAHGLGCRDEGQRARGQVPREPGVGASPRTAAPRTGGDRAAPTTEVSRADAGAGAGGTPPLVGDRAAGSHAVGVARGPADEGESPNNLACSRPLAVNG